MIGYRCTHSDVFSRVVLIARKSFCCEGVFSHLRYSQKHRLVEAKQKRKRQVIKDLGGNSDEVPPLPIPNREVKLVSADGIALNV